MVFINRVILDVEETTVVLSYSFYPVSFQSHVLRHLVIVRICDSKKLLKKYSILSAYKKRERKKKNSLLFEVMTEVI